MNDFTKNVMEDSFKKAALANGQVDESKYFFQQNL
jgi:hypothetical protein